MELMERKTALIKLGRELKGISEESLQQWAREMYNKNKWFTEENITSAVQGIAFLLSEDELNKWEDKYKREIKSPKNIGIVMAGNLPAVGFHDLLAVLWTGHKAHVKLSSQDDVLVKKLTQILLDIEPRFNEMIFFPDKITGMDAVIATGSDNTSRYFEYYFAKIPHIIRKNRTSVGVLNGEEDITAYEKLSDDIFKYFGMGCRNVSKIFVPEGWKYEFFFQGTEKYKDIIHHNKYLNNYEYQKSIFLINKVPHLDNGYLLLKEDQALVSPISVLFYEYYKDVNQIKLKLNEQKEKIQVVLSNGKWFDNSLDFGTSQNPGICDYPDGVDIVEFLYGLN